MIGKVRKSVLIIGAIWPYHNGGARVPGLAKYLPEHGWEPVVLTWPLPENAEFPYRVEAVEGDEAVAVLVKGMGGDPHRGVRTQLAQKLGISSDNRLLRWTMTRARELGQYPDGHRRWRKSATQRALALVRDEHFDAIISTSPPVSCHLVAAEVKRHYGLPWVADFPHLWSQDHATPYGAIRRAFDRRLELRTLCATDVLTTTNAPHAERLAELHGDGRVVAISHGYDPDYVNEPPESLNSSFNLVHTGTFSRGVREPGLVLQALRLLLDQGGIDRECLQVDFHGPVYDWVEKDIARYGLVGLVRQRGWASGELLRQAQRRAQVLLLPKFEPSTGSGMLSSKVFDYLAAGRPVLAFGSHWDAADGLLEWTGAGVSAWSVADTAACLGKFYQEHVGAGRVTYRGDSDRIRAYSHSEMARKFTALLD